MKRMIKNQRKHFNKIDKFYIIEVENYEDFRSFSIFLHFIRNFRYRNVIKIIITYKIINRKISSNISSTTSHLTLISKNTY
jgi:hypothetical protein